MSPLQKSTLSLMLYLADNLAYIPYTVVDEPLFVIHQIDIMISVAGSNLLQTFKEVCGLFKSPFGIIMDSAFGLFTILKLIQTQIEAINVSHLNFAPPESPPPSVRRGAARPRDG